MNNNIPPAREIFDHFPFVEITITKKAMYLHFYSEMLIRIFLLGPQRSVGLPDVHSGCGFAIAIGKLQFTHL